MEMRTWLTGLGLAQYADSFDENDITLDLLPDLTAEDLKDIGVSSVGHRRRILAAAASLSEGGRPAPKEGAEPHGRVEEKRPSASGTGAPAALVAERRQLTVLFSDLVGSTALSAALDPEEMGELLQRYHRTVAEAVQAMDGFIAQYLGDGIVCYFGYPVAHEREPERAVRAGLAIVEAVSRLTDPVGKPLAARVGIATGLVVVGDVISDRSHDRQTVIGETPNLAARLQALGEPRQVIVAPETANLLNDSFVTESMGEVEIAGLPAPIRPSRIIEITEDMGPESKRVLGPLIGRQGEAELLLGRWAAATEGEPQLLLLSGEAGVGKTRLVEDIVHRVRERNGNVQRFYSSPYHRNAAYFPVIAHLERAAGFARGDSSARRLDKLDALFERLAVDPDQAGPLIAPLLSLPAADRYPPLNLAPTAVKSQTFEVLRELLLNHWQEAPLLVVLEDAHWLDPTTTQLWEYLLSGMAEEASVMFLVTFRPEYNLLWRDVGVRTSTITLSRLTRRRATEVVEAVTGGRPLPDEVLEHILAKADGVPLFLEEITKTVIESPMLKMRGDHYTLTGAMDSFAIPSTLKDSLMSRLDRLAPVKEVAQISSVIGRRFSRALLGALAEMPDDALERGIEALLDAELIFRGGTPDNRIYTFKHALIRDAAYESILNRRRAELHARVAEVLEKHFPETAAAEPELVARHYSDANKPDRAAPHWLRAGRKAMEASAMAEALDHLGRGLELAARIQDVGAREHCEYELRSALGLCHISLEGWQAPAVGEHLLPAYESGRRLGEVESLLPIMYGLWIHWLNRANFAESRRWIDQAGHNFGGAGSDDWDLVIHTMETIQQRWAGSHARVESEMQKVLSLYDSDRHGKFVYMFGNDPKVAALGFQSWSSWITGDPEKAERERVACAEHSERVNHPFDRCWQLMVGALAAYFDERRDAFASSVAEAVAIGDRQKVPFVQFILGPVWTGLVHVLDGNWKGAIESMPRGIETWQQMGGGVALPFWKATLGYAHLRRGGDSAPARALELIDEAIATAERTGEYWFEPEAHRLRAHALLSVRPDDRGSARAALEHAAALARAQGAAAWERRAAESIVRLEL